MVIESTLTNQYTWVALKLWLEGKKCKNAAICISFKIWPILDADKLLQEINISLNRMLPEVKK